MNEEYIEENEWFKCTIDGITYDCKIKYYISRYLSKHSVSVKVRKYLIQKWWFFKWKIEEFECENSPNISTEQYRIVNGNFYFKPEFIQDWVRGALDRRETEIIRNKFQKEEEKKLKVIKEI